MRNMDPAKIWNLNKKGYLDSAVIGGLDKFLQSWSTQISNSISDTQLLKRFSRICPPNPDYALMNKVQRKEWANSILELLNELENPTAQNNQPITAELKPEAKVTPEGR